MAELQLTSPNTCAVIDLGFAPGPELTPVVYIPENTGYNAKIGVPDSYSSFQEFDNPQDALVAALAIDPSFDVNQIFGPLGLDPVNVSDPEVSAYAGDPLTLNCEYSCGDCEVKYKWLNPGGLVIPGATSSTLTFSNLVGELAGVYTCNASAQNEKGQTGIVSNRFKVTVYPAISPVADEQS